jgi:hypothetical protein
MAIMGRRLVRRTPLRLVPLVLFACSRAQPPPPERTEPWPAPATSSRGAPAGHHTRYVIEPRANVRFELPAREATPSGVFRVARGELEVDLAALARSRGFIEIDVASVQLEAEQRELALGYTEQALSWLDVGASRPEAARERLRWARFTLRSIQTTSAQAAWEGVRVDAGLADTATPGEERAVTLRAVGDFELHGYRVERSLEVRVTFTYPSPAAPSATPVGLAIETREPFDVELAVHAIEPRDPQGRLVAADLKLLGGHVGRAAGVRAQVTARLRAR